MKNRESLDHEIVRKLLHMLIAFLPWLYSWSRSISWTLLISGTVFYSISEYVRLDCLRNDGCRFTIFRVVNKVTLFVSRERERGSFVFAPITLALGAGLSLLIFSPIPARIGILVLAFGDTAAALIGRLLPIHALPFSSKKSWGGFLACMCASFAVSYLILGDLLHSLILSVTAATVEALPLGDYDNVLIPISTALLIQLLLNS